LIYLPNIIYCSGEALTLMAAASFILKPLQIWLGKWSFPDNYQIYSYRKRKFFT